LYNKPEVPVDKVQHLVALEAPMLYEDFIRLNIKKDLEDAAIAGAAFLRGICDGTISAPVSVRAKYASLALSRVGLGPIQRGVSPLQPHLTREEIEQLKARAKEAQEGGRMLPHHNGNRVIQLLDVTAEDLLPN